MFNNVSPDLNVERFVPTIRNGEINTTGNFLSFQQEKGGEIITGNYSLLKLDYCLLNISLMFSHMLFLFFHGANYIFSLLYIFPNRREARTHGGSILTTGVKIASAILKKLVVCFRPLTNPFLFIFSSWKAANLRCIKIPHDFNFFVAAFRTFSFRLANFFCGSFHAAIPHHQIGKNGVLPNAPVNLCDPIFPFLSHYDSAAPHTSFQGVVG